MFLVFCDGHFKVELFFSWHTWTHTGIILTNGRWCTWGVPRHAWLRCCVCWCTDCSLTAQEGKSHWQIWNKDTFCLCNHSARNRAEDFGKISSAVFFASAQRQGEYMRILPPLRVMGNHGCDILQLTGQWLIAPPFCPGMQTNWMARHDLAGGTCMKLLRKGSTLNLARDVWHGSWIYRTGPYSPNQTKDMTTFFCCPTWLVFFLHKSLFSVAVRLQNASKRYKTVIQQCAEDAIHVRSLVPASVASASFPNGFLEISVLSSLQPDQDGTKWLMTFRTHSQSWETFRHKSVTSISMLHHAPSAGRSLHLHKHVLSPHMPPFCHHQLVYETSLQITHQYHKCSWISLMVLRAPLLLCCMRSKGNHEYNLLRWGQCGAPLPDPEGQIHESYAKTVQDLKALAHQLWDQGDMLDEMKQRQDCSKQTSLWMESNIVVCMSCKFLFICLLKLVRNFVHLR